jgi:hypothetical protein
VGRVHRVGAVGGVPRGVRVPAESVLTRIRPYGLSPKIVNIATLHLI